MKKCRYAKCGREFGPAHANREYCTTKCQRAAWNDARRKLRTAKRESCKRCGKELGPHHKNREYHPDCRKEAENQTRRALREVNKADEREKQRNRYAARRAKGPLLTVECSYREKGVHTFETRDRRLRYCCDEHRELGEAILQRAVDRRSYRANPQREKDKNRAAYARRMEMAAQGKILAGRIFCP